MSNTEWLNEHRIVLRYGEIALKGGNRQFFESRLLKNIKKELKLLPDAKVTKEHGRLYVQCTKEHYDTVMDVLSRAYGLVSYSPARVVGLPIEEVEAGAIEEMTLALADYKGKNTTFKVEVKRTNKNYPFTSPELTKRIGGVLLNKFPELKVDVHNPEIRVEMEVRDKIYLFSRTIKGQGGMPYKTGGKAMLLLSGGIDSPVAGYLMAKRGVEIEAVHFHSYPYTSERAREKVFTLARKLTAYTGRVRVHCINLLEVQQAIMANCPSDEMTILSRRFMMAIATEIAKERGCGALITGESLGQVASQTMEGIQVTTDATAMPVLRPLIAMDKVDITLVAKAIDTFETSILPFEDCCTIFLPDKVVTKPLVADIRESEARLDVQSLIANAVAGMEVILIKPEEDFEL